MNLLIQCIPIPGYILLSTCNQGNVEAWFLYQEETIMRFLSPYRWRVWDHCNDGFNGPNIDKLESQVSLVLA